MIDYLKKHTNAWLVSIIGWTGAFYLYFIISYWGLSGSLNNSILDDYLSSWLAHLEIILGSFFFGIFFGVINSLTDNSKLRNKPILIIVLLKSFLYITALLIASAIIYWIYNFFDLLPQETYNQLLNLFSPFAIASMLLYLIVVLVFFNFIIILNKKLGKGNIVNLLFGRYQKPKVEERIFMFLDLKDSTTIAEKLGHKKYSSMIRECFHDLTDILIKYNGEVYQYVGDEVVIMWKPGEGFRNFNCVRTYFDYQNKLNNLKNEYILKYGSVPFFRAGMDMGTVTVVEIGDLKREIAYHGDVLNTASRIQEQCKMLSEKILVSKNIIDNLNFNNGFTKNSLGEFVLKGKRNSVEVFSISYN
ncbi:MAG: adenylate/guanylate cyclase domain-containing protein [Melioribacteraceae bacterium]|nr:adenylate/guanylate cyclase domain-containing protein [Melioribacteraceae bacterium]